MRSETLVALRKRLATLALIAATSAQAACSLLFAPSPARAIDGGDEEFDARSGCDFNIEGATSRLEIKFASAPGLGETFRKVPLPVRFTPSDFATYALPAAPESLRFFERDTPLLHEVEAWSPETGGLVWVLIDTYPTVGELPFAMYFGGDSPVSVEDSEELWAQAGYSAVFHFDGGDFRDSRNPTQSGEFDEQKVIQVDSSRDGVLGHALEFTGDSAASVSVADHPGHGASSEDLTLEARFNLTDLVPPLATDQLIVEKEFAYSLHGSVGLEHFSRAARAIQGAAGETEITGGLLQKEQWIQAALVVAANGGNRMYFIIDGDAVDAETSISDLRTDSTSPLTIGAGFAGVIDELRISPQARTASWQQLQTSLFDGGLQSFGSQSDCQP